MAPTLEASLTAIFGTEVTPPAPEVTPPSPVAPEAPEVTVSDTVASLIEQAQQHYDKAQQYLQAGDWTGYGEELDALKTVLDRLAELTSAETS